MSYLTVYAIWPGERHAELREFRNAGGEVCALGAVGQIRQLDMTDVDPEDCQVVARLFDIAEPLAREIVYQNDEAGSHLRDETPEHRWARVRAWAASQLLPTADGQG